MATSTISKVAVAAGAVVIAGAALYVLSSGESPIEVGDGSVTIQYPYGVDKHSNQEVEASKFLHSIKEIRVLNYADESEVQRIDVKKRAWTLTSNVTPQVNFSPGTIVLGNGLVGTCTSNAGWNGSASQFTCVPDNAAQFTPATLTFTDGDCPVPGTPKGTKTCAIACPTGKCKLRFIYNRSF